MRRTSAVATAAIMGLVAMLMTGCSQISALAPVGGDALRTVSIAVGDILQEQGIDVLVVPVCEQTGKAATCTGRTVDGRDIAVTADLNSPITMTLTVGGTQVFSGRAQDVVDQAAQR